MSIRYEVTGYGHKTGRLVTYYDVPEKRIARIKKIAGVPSSDDGVGSYPLGRNQVAAIGRVLETPIEQAADVDYFLEAYDGNSDRSAAG